MIFLGGEQLYSGDGGHRLAELIIQYHLFPNLLVKFFYQRL